MAVKTDRNHLPGIPLTCLAQPAITHQHLKSFNFFLVSLPFIRVVNLEMIHFQQGVIIFLDMHNVVELAFISRFQCLVKPVGIILQQADENLFLFADVCDTPNGQLGLWNVKGVPLIVLQAELFQSLTFQTQIAPTAFVLELLNRQINPVKIEKSHGSIRNLSCVAADRFLKNTALILRVHRFNPGVQIKIDMRGFDLSCKLGRHFIQPGKMDPLHLHG